jgi:hypothetical protein
MFLLNICAAVAAARHCDATRKMQTNFTTLINLNVYKFTQTIVLYC